MDPVWQRKDGDQLETEKGRRFVRGVRSATGPAWLNVKDRNKYSRQGKLPNGKMSREGKARKCSYIPAEAGTELQIAGLSLGANLPLTLFHDTWRCLQKCLHHNRSSVKCKAV